MTMQKEKSFSQGRRTTNLLNGQKTKALNFFTVESLWSAHLFYENFSSIFFSLSTSSALREIPFPIFS